MSQQITILGAKTLGRYTEHLERGFLQNGWIPQDQSKNILLQIHGSPAAEAEDRLLLAYLEKLANTTETRKIIILVHRPDEVKDRLPEFETILKTFIKPVHVVFLGDAFVNDPFYQKRWVKTCVIPHGFFDFTANIPQTIVVGTHTTWGEMRSVDHVLHLLGLLFKQNISGVMGYLGGLPANELETDVLERKFKAIHPDVSVCLTEFKNIDTVQQKKHLIMTRVGKSQPEELEIMFNTQLYYYGNRIRTGESSGSVHATLSIPVIIEMNGADRIEDLAVIKVPYEDVSDIKSVNFAHAAQDIANVITSGKYRAMLEHNKKQIVKFDSKFVAGEYIRIFLGTTS